jgi:1,4-dihydroxy-2-naphthoate octaprenyltransferase
MSRRVRLFIQLSRPLFLIGGALVYALGAGIARYLGSPIDFGLYIIGQVWVTSMQLSTHYLNEYFDAPLDQDNSSRTPFSGGSGAIGPGKLTRNTALIAAMTTLTVLASITVVLLQQTEVSSLLVLLLMAIFFGAILYSTPPVQLSSSGYGELTTSFLVANLVPALAFYLQYHDLHRLVAMSTFPLTSLHMAMMIAFELPDYATDLKYEKNTLLFASMAYLLAFSFWTR